MLGAPRQTKLDPRARTFDVICAGSAQLKAADQDGSRAFEAKSTFRFAGGAIQSALALASEGMRVGLASVLSDDTTGRALRAKISATGVDAGGVALAAPRSELLLVRGGARQVVSFHEGEPPIFVPEDWSAPMLLLSGVSPIVSHGAALCKAARAARREGTLVVVDVNADWHLWKGRDSRAIRMVLREADVVSCSAQDLFGLNMDVPTLRASLRPAAVLVLNDGAGRASARGPFGEVVHALDDPAKLPALGDSAAFNAAICAELTHAGRTGEGGGALWSRALRRALGQTAGHAPAHRA